MKLNWKNIIFHRSRRVDRIEKAVIALEASVLEQAVKINTELAAFKKLLESAPLTTDKQLRIMAQKIYTELSGAMHKLSMAELDDERSGKSS